MAWNRFEIGGVGAAVASLIECYSIVALFCESREDVAPGEGQFREAMDAENEWWSWG